MRILKTASIGLVFVFVLCLSGCGDENANAEYVFGDLTPLAKTILKDKTVTPGELQQVTDAYVQC